MDRASKNVATGTATMSVVAAGMLVNEHEKKQRGSGGMSRSRTTMFPKM